MKQSKRALSKLPRRKDGQHFLTIPRKVDTGLPAIVVPLYSNSSKCSDTKLSRKRCWITFPVVWPSATSKLITTVIIHHIAEHHMKQTTESSGTLLNALLTVRTTFHESHLAGKLLTNLEQTPMNRCHQLLAPYKGLIDDNNKTDKQ